MRIKEKGYVLLTAAQTGKNNRKREGWLEMLRQWLVECPQCAEVWLVVGARNNDIHVCKECRHRFAIRLISTQEQSKTSPEVAARGKFQLPD